jgi:hypothetical protein
MPDGSDTKIGRTYKPKHHHSSPVMIFSRKFSSLLIMF